MLRENAHQPGLRSAGRSTGIPAGSAGSMMYRYFSNNGVGEEPVAHPGDGGLGLDRVVAGQPDFQVLADANIGDGVVAQAVEAAEDGLAWGALTAGLRLT